MLVKNPSKRITLMSIMQHPWIYFYKEHKERLEWGLTEEVKYDEIYRENNQSIITGPSVFPSTISVISAFQDNLEEESPSKSTMKN